MSISNSSIQVLHNPNTSRIDKILLVVDSSDVPLQIKEIRQLGVVNGITGIKKWNISSYLSRAKGLVMCLPEGWKLTQSGRKYLSEKFELGFLHEVVNDISELTKLQDQVTDEQTKAYISETIRCYEAGCIRAAIVLSWVGAISLFYSFVYKNHLIAFNNELANGKKYNFAIHSIEDFSQITDYDLLKMLLKLLVIKPNVEKQLQHCRDNRNACGHPTYLQIGQKAAGAHLETLINHVYTQFSH